MRLRSSVSDSFNRIFISGKVMFPRVVNKRSGKPIFKFMLKSIPDKGYRTNNDLFPCLMFRSIALHYQNILKGGEEVFILGKIFTKWWKRKRNGKLMKGLEIWIGVTQIMILHFPEFIDNFKYNPELNVEYDDEGEPV